MAAGVLLAQVDLDALPADPPWLWAWPVDRAGEAAAAAFVPTGNAAADAAEKQRQVDAARASASTADKRRITMAAGSRPAPEIRWLITDPALWSDGRVPMDVPAGLDAPARSREGRALPAGPRW